MIWNNTLTLGAGEANRIYFERRKGQYRTENVAPVRIFDVRETARCYAALVMMRPDLSSRYPNRLTGELLSDVFAQGAPEEDYYTACYSHYRLKMLTSNKRFDGRYSKLRWHIITAASKYCGAKYREMGCRTKNEALYNLFPVMMGTGLIGLIFWLKLHYLILTSLVTC